MDNLDQKIQQGIETFMRNGQFNLTKIQQHEHNGTDTVKISQKNIINNDKYQLNFSIGYPFTTASPTGGSILLANLPNIAQMSFNGIAANEGNGGTVNLTYSGLSGTLHNGDVVTLQGNTFTITSFTGSVITATVTTANVLPLPTGNFTTNASASGSITAILATKVASIIGAVQFGNCYSRPILTGLTFTFSNTTQSFVQSYSSTYTDTSNLANTVVLEGTDGFANVLNNAFASVVELKVLQYTQGQIEIGVTISAGWAIIGNLILT